MGFRRIKVPVLRTDGKVEFRLGWTEKGGDIGYFSMKRKTKNGTLSYWKYIATDMKTGARVCECETRKDCASWVSLNKETIAAARQNPKYIALVNELNTRIKKGLIVKGGF